MCRGDWLCCCCCCERWDRNNPYIKADTEKAQEENFSLQLIAKDGNDEGDSIGIDQALNKHQSRIQEELTQLQRKLGENAKQIIDLSNAKKNQDQHIASQDKKLTDSLAQGNSLKAQLDHSKSSIHKLEATNHALEKQQSKIQVEMKELQRKLGEAAKEIIDLANAKTEQEKQLVAKDKTLTDALAQGNSLKAHLDHSKSSIHKLEATNHALEKQQSKLQVEMKELQRKLEEAAKEIRDLANAKTENEKQLAAKDKTLNDSVAKENSLQAKIVNLKRYINTLEASKREEINKLQSKLGEAAKEIIDLSNAKTERDKQLNVKDKTLNDSLAKENSLKAQLGHLHSSLHKFEATNYALVKQQSKVQEEMEAIQRKLGEDAKEIIDLSIAKREQEKQLAAKDKTLKDSLARENSLKEDIKHLKISVRTLVATSQKLEDEDKDLKMKNAAQEENYSKTRNYHDQLLARLLIRVLKLTDKITLETEMFLRGYGGASVESEKYLENKEDILEDELTDLQRKKDEQEAQSFDQGWGRRPYRDYELSKRNYLRKIASLSNNHWRKDDIHWNDTKYQDLLMKYALYAKPRTEMNIKWYNILLIAPVGAGKSSFLNNIKSVLKSRIVFEAKTGTAAKSMTLKYRSYPIRDGSRQKCGFRICDTPGLHGDFSYSEREFKTMINGNIPEGYKFDGASAHDEGFNQDNADTKIHCVCFVFNASIFEVMEYAELKSLRKYQALLNLTGITQAIILTHIDKMDPELKYENVKNVFHSDRMHSVVSRAMSKFDIPLNRIFPIKNYECETQPVLNVDILTLYTLKNMLDMCEYGVSASIKATKKKLCK